MADNTTQDSGNDTTVVFEMSGRTVVLDVDPDKVMGDAAMLVDDHAGSHNAWITRMLTGEPTARDLLLLGYLGSRQTNPRLEWSYFVRSVAPWSLRIISIAGVKLTRPGAADDQAAEDQAASEKPAAEKPADNTPPPRRRQTRTRTASTAAAT